MIHRIASAVAHVDQTITVTWLDGVTARVDLSPLLAKGRVFAPLQDPGYFVTEMRVADDRLGIEWPCRVDLSADGLRFRAFPDQATAEFGDASLGENRNVFPSDSVGGMGDLRTSDVV